MQHYDLVEVVTQLNNTSAKLSALVVIKKARTLVLY